jgi:L-ascorbate metabolism protein UlaG (beta-lactamase superfamily)/drug/metabolite transporter (DMT)-like permease
VLVVALVLLSAFLHALWNALLKRQAEKDLAGAAVVAIAELTAIAAAAIGWIAGGRPPFPDLATVGWSAAAGVFEAGYFLALVAALERAPLGVAYTVSRGVAILAVWPISIVLLHEGITPLDLAGTALLVLGLMATAPLRGTRGLGLAVLCGVFIAGYHLCYKRAMVPGAQAAAVFAVSLGVALPLNLARLGRARLPALFAHARARPLALLGLGAICGASFLLFLGALASSGAGFVLTLRNTSIVFATALGWAIADPPTRRQLAGALLVAVGATLLVSCTMYSAPPYRGPVTDHFDGRRFKNAASKVHGARDFLKWTFNRERGPWREWVDDPPGPPPPRRVARGEMRVTFVNHATTLVQMDGVNILTDPIWSERASPVSFAGPRRHRPPGIRFEDLPPIDAVIVSHNHYDHMDLGTLARLAEQHHPKIFVALGNDLLLDQARIPGAVAMDWWQALPMSPDVEVTCVPAQHFSRRGLFDADATLWAGFLVRGPSGSMYFAGDTGYGPHFAEIAQRVGPIRLALLPIGAYRPRWFMAPVHMDPGEAVRAHADLGAGTSLGIHFGTFALADDGELEPLEELGRVLEDVPAKPRFWVLGFGEGRDVP